MNTVITKSNEVRVYDPDYAVLAISDIGDCIVITDSGEIIVNQGNPITWPADASDGLQAIVDVKAGTLRFGYDGWPWSATEFVVSNYSEQFVSVEDCPAAITAASMLTAALGHMEDRAKTYDAPGGERSMGKTVSAFNAITGLELTEEQGWLFMEILKQVRSQQGNYRADNYEDMVAYAALRGECAARERGDKL